MRKVKAIAEEDCEHTFSPGTVRRIHMTVDEVLQRLGEPGLTRPISMASSMRGIRKSAASGLVRSQAPFIVKSRQSCQMIIN
jgi:hypothetical protein